MRISDWSSDVCSSDLNLGGATSVDVTHEGVDKAWGLRRLAEHSGVAQEDMLFIGDAIFPGGNDYPAQAMGLDTVCVRDPADRSAERRGGQECVGTFRSRWSP